jgi:hypothetical protein
VAADRWWCDERQSRKLLFSRGSTTPACTLQLATFTLAPVYYSAPVSALAKIASLFCIPQDFLYVICID